MHTYETQPLTPSQTMGFISLFNKRVGTEFEKDRDNYYKTVITCFELEENEVEICREIENSL